MKQFIKWTGLAVVAGVVGLGLALLFVAGAQTQSPAAVVERVITQSTPTPYPNNWGWGWPYGYRREDGSAGTYTPTQAFPNDYYYYGHGPGMMGGWGMDPYGHMGGMMGGRWGYGYGTVPQGTSVPVDQEIQLKAANFRFDPATITVQAGETVRLVVSNNDGVPHNLYSRDSALAYALLPAGVVQPVTFTAPDAPGTYLAVCTFHPGMTLEIIVK